ncbi:FAD-dependent oxidoreductase [Aurantiacibacter gangjinensis]|uniref:Pyridine nucleotide-disulfide oxidoreductase n=1 Tax=Aurantiacibacter gangjinensis TaxID=502682 RepID=A0A0G9MTS9_9SPHN|nr:FAD-dependent oxidoreductase [Aurantiacibacter gangjinensis]APE28504.1 Ferredoxin--NADP(+) reductase, actinobacterial (eukaryote-like) type [Aurantiacibacter gangjinensis]KLE32708.1 pyridine nucleotide-disulfide oxidoreductase [Aurantiacibacter gangjinensis]
MRHIAIIGSGPAGYYTAEAAQKQFGDNVRVDIFDMLPVPYGLIRTGVAPDHQSIKGVSRRYEKTALTENVRFVGNIRIGEAVSVDDLRELYDAVVIATGAPVDRDLGIEGEDLANAFGSAAFVGWYNGHPQFAGLDPDLSGTTAVVIGMGNVALDVARILAKTPDEFAGSDIVAHALETLRSSNIERIVLLGRRGPHQIMMTPKELGELAELERAAPHVDTDDLPDEAEDAILEPGLRKSVGLLRQFAATPEHIRAEKRVAIEFAFQAQPVALRGDGKVEAVEIERTELVKGRAVGTGKTERLRADIVISCIGYRTAPIPGVPFDERAGRFANDDGRILPGLYAVGWAKRGPSGTIGTNKPDGFNIIEKIGEDFDAGVIGKGRKAGREGFDALAAERELDYVTFRDWKKIEEAETAAAREGSPREKFVDIEAMIKAVN